MPLPFKIAQYVFLSSLLAIVVGAGCDNKKADSNATKTEGSSSSSSAKEQITLLLNWYPEAEHGGYYAALVHGYYAEEGLDVTIQPGGRSVWWSRRNLRWAEFNSESVMRRCFDVSIGRREDRSSDGTLAKWSAMHHGARRLGHPVVSRPKERQVADRLGAPLRPIPEGQRITRFERSSRSLFWLGG